jgi:LmbE family N-acetylglucosaminyl deacetylase
MEHDPDAPAIVLSPHLDDAVLSAWTVLRGPVEVLVVNLCTAVPPAGVLGAWDRVLGGEDSAELMKLRLAEDREALALAGRRAIALDLLDEQYREVLLDAGDLRRALEPRVERASAVYAPAGLGGHGDHVAAREAALSLARDAGALVFLYADLPYAVRFGWPHWVTGEEEPGTLRPDARWDEHLVTASCPRSALMPRVTTLSEDEAARKLRALRAYRTQFAALDGGSLGLLSNPRIIGFELLWEVREN